MKSQETVFLLHGLCRLSTSMWLLRWRLQRVGYRVRLFSYFSPRGSIERHAKHLASFIDVDQQGRDGGFHLVGHSLGGLLSRYYASVSPSKKLRRIVMLAPPNRPSSMARIFKNNPLFRFLTGRVGQQLASENFFNKLPQTTCDIGVIAGGKGDARGHASWLEGDNDYIVRTDETKFNGMKEWVLIKSGHTFIMHRQQTFKLIVSFLTKGSFLDSSF